MLACSQDIFNNNSNIIDSYQNLMHHDKQHLDKRVLSSMLVVANDGLAPQQQNSLKDKEEQVWPPDVENAFIAALESIPKLGRRKILVNGKPCGRNELISDFIFRKTNKIRTRKQVSSHIQVLKNTRKGDSHFMRLLTDSMDMSDHSTTTLLKSNKMLRQHYPILKGENNNKLMKKNYQQDSSDESSINSSSPSPTDYVFDIMCGDPAQQQALSMLQFKDFYDTFQQSIFTSVLGSSAPNLSSDSTPLFDQDALFRLTAEPAAVVAPLPPPPPPTKKKTTVRKQNMKKKRKTQHVVQPPPPPPAAATTTTTTTTTTATTTTTTMFQNPLIGSSSCLWPNYICLYLEYTLPYDPCRPLSHNLSQLPHCFPTCLPITTAISKEKCPPITSLLTSQPILLLAKTRLDLNLNISDFTFNNTSFFETQTRRTIECTTTIYSFGNMVLKSKETQQALWVNEGKYMYSFVFVNQFFDAFMKGIRSLQSWDEVDIAINNLCIVQSFEDTESKYAIPSTLEQESLLVMVYEFERGEGTMDISAMVASPTSPEHMTTKSLVEEFFDQDL